MKRLIVLFLFYSIALQAQFHVKGIVKDASTNNPLPFATINTNTGVYTVSDVEGNFLVKSKSPIDQITIKYVGYLNLTIPISQSENFYTIRLNPTTIQLNDVAVSNDNFGVKIIKKTIANKSQNDPQKKQKSFEFKAYNRLLITADIDSIDETIDTIIAKKINLKNKVKLDSANYKFKEIISKQHLFQTEKVSKFQFAENHLKETIIGTKMAGFKKPIYELIAFNLQSFSVYDPHYELLEMSYNSPIADDALRYYNYKLLDTITIDNRKTVMIYFKNKRKRNSAGLEGVLYIDLQNYAIAKADISIQSVININGVHEFKYIPENNLWITTTTKFKITKGKNDENINFLIGTIQFDQNNTSEFKKRKKEISDLTYIESETNYFDFKYNIPIEIKHPSIKININDDAFTQPESFWNKYRKDSLDMFTQRTYASLDSISIKNKIENRLAFGRKILAGYVPIGFSDINLKNIISFNNYEGFRLGIGGITNEKFSKNIKLDGYVAYGTKDKAVKYSLGVGKRLDKYSNSWINASYTDDIMQIATTVWAVDKRIFKLYDPRSLNFSTFYKYQTWKAFLESKIIPKTETVIEFANSFIQPKFNYAFEYNGVLYPNYTMTTGMISFRWNPNSDYMQTPTGREEVKKRYPKITLQFTQSLPAVWNNDFVFSKIDFRTDYNINHLDGQQTYFVLEAGIAFGAVPLTHLYSTSPNNLNEDTVWQRLTFAGKNSFETMYFNEFFSSEFISLQFKHRFNRITISKSIEPAFTFVTRAAWGEMKNPQNQVGISYKTLNQGFYESGLELNQIYKGFGFGTYYRYGANHLSDFEDNIAIKFTYILDLSLY